MHTHIHISYIIAYRYVYVYIYIYVYPGDRHTSSSCMSAVLALERKDTILSAADLRAAKCKLKSSGCFPLLTCASRVALMIDRRSKQVSYALSPC